MSKPKKKKLREGPNQDYEENEAKAECDVRHHRLREDGVDPEEVDGVECRDHTDTNEVLFPTHDVPPRTRFRSPDPGMDPTDRPVSRCSTSH